MICQLMNKVEKLIIIIIDRKEIIFLQRYEKIK